MAVGDVLLHEDVFLGARQADGTYDFSRLFRSMKASLSAADIAVADFEGTLGGTPYSGYPYFSAPDAIAAALAQAGFDLVTTANNHAFDRGTKGLVRTATVLRAAGLGVVGTRTDAADPPFIVVDRNGIRIGFAAYTFETPTPDDRKRINGIPLARDAEPLLDTFNPYASSADVAADLAAMAAREKAMREAGADFTIFLLHWGEEYRTKSGAYQRRMAQELSDAGVDCIFGHHPHVLQEAAVVRSADGAHDLLVYYSVGNFVSNMLFGTHGTSGKTEDGLVAGITIRRGDDGKVRVVRADYLPIYVYKPIEGGRRRHEVVPSTDPRAAGSLERIRAIMAGSTGTDAIPIVERLE